MPLDPKLAVPDFEVSDPRFEVDGIRHLTVNSQALGGRGDISIFVPEGTGNAARLPIVWLLHGVYGSHWTWFLKGGAAQTARRLIANGTIRPMVLACPSDGLWRDGSGYIDQDAGNFGTWITRDAVNAVRQLLGGGDTSSKLLIAGLSMGGYGAFRLGATHGTMFAGISAHSSITRPEEFTMFVRELPSPADTTDNRDVLSTLEAHRTTLPPIRFDCGTDDQLLPGNRRLHEGLKAAGIAHEYVEYSGGHTWDYWEAHLEQSLTFFEGILDS